MKFRVLLLGSMSAVAISGSALAAGSSCGDDRYACEPTVTAEASEPLALQPSRHQATPRKIRRARSHARRAPRLAGSRPRIVEMEKAPPEKPRELEKAPPENILPKATLNWAPIDVPSNAVAPFEALDASAPPAPSPNDVRVVSADQVNEIDLAAPSQPVKVIPVRIDAQTMPGTGEVMSADRPVAPADPALLERVLVTFGGAFGAASAMRLFLG
ncbi:MAG TPA: hypothetical protein VHA55_02260 [Pseudorhodoplanes sp.]|jgi:hypothetical protein|nr:hypothetical protein [Pseudorhodoplanes sp.]